STHPTVLERSVSAQLIVDAKTGSQLLVLHIHLVIGVVQTANSLGTKVVVKTLNPCGPVICKGVFSAKTDHIASPPLGPIELVRIRLFQPNRMGVAIRQATRCVEKSTVKGIA